MNSSNYTLVSYLSDIDLKFIPCHCLTLPIEDRERNLAKSILARVCTLNVCGYSTLLRSVQ